MSDLNSALSNIYNHLNNFNLYSQDSVAELHKDNEMLKSMNAHQVDMQSLELAAKISTKVRVIQENITKPSLGAQQMVATKADTELKEIRKRIKDILEILPKHDIKIESNHRPKT